MHVKWLLTIISNIINLYHYNIIVTSHVKKITLMYYALSILKLNYNYVKNIVHGKVLLIVAAAANTHTQLRKHILVLTCAYTRTNVGGIAVLHHQS